MPGSVVCYHQGHFLKIVTNFQYEVFSKVPSLTSSLFKLTSFALCVMKIRYMAEQT